MNHRRWNVIFVNPSSINLIDREGRLTLATTDPVTDTVCIANDICGDLLERVIKHELAHCVMISYGMLHDIHKAVYKRYWIDAEEWICNFIADYSNDILTLSNQIMNSQY